MPKARAEVSEREAEPILGSVRYPWEQEIFRNSQGLSHLEMTSTFMSRPSSDLDKSSLFFHVRTLHSHSCTLIAMAAPHQHLSRGTGGGCPSAFSSRNLLLWIQVLQGSITPIVSANSPLNSISVLEMSEPRSWNYWRDRPSKAPLPASFWFCLCWGL